jgi:hypothetical protein
MSNYYNTIINRNTSSDPNLQYLIESHNRAVMESRPYKSTSLSRGYESNSTVVRFDTTSTGPCMVHTMYGCQSRIGSVIG